MCLKKWEHEQAQKPVKERDHMPQPPKGYMEQIS